MYEPSPALRDELVKATEESMHEDSIAEPCEESIVQFVEDNLTENACARMGIYNRVLLLLFAGEGTRKKLARIVGDDFPQPEEYGRTIRGTYGEYTRLLTGEALNFEPSVLIAHSEKSNRKKLEIFAKYAESDGGIMVIFLTPSSLLFLDLRSIPQCLIFFLPLLIPSIRNKRSSPTRACRWRTGW